ncbi:MAG: hypothetical protein KDA73_15570 [Rhodobacteraceae bacterium]|nr:hypothetical protein [Paracoccaceae bacterium]
MITAAASDIDTDLVEIVSTAIDVTTRPEQWDELCERVNRAAGTIAFMAFEYDTVRHAAPHFHGSRATRAELGDLCEEFSQGVSPEDVPAFELLARLPAGQFVNEHVLFGVAPHQAFPPLDFRDRVLAATGARSRSAMRLNDCGPWMDVAVVHNRESSSETDAGARKLTGLLHSILTRAMETSRIFAALTQGYQTLLHLFDRLDFAVAFCDGSGHILTANRRFHEIAAERDGLTDANGIAGATRPADHARLTACICAALRPDARPDRLITTLSRRSGSLPLVVRTAPVNESDVRRGTALSLLMVLDPEDGNRISAEGLAAFDLLTTAELELCSMLVRGMQDEEISRLRGTTVASAQSQIDAARAKLMCRTRLDILRLAIATSRPISSPRSQRSTGARP